MPQYTDEDLENLLDDLESDLAERKESFRGDAPTKVREAVCAFANDLPNHRRAADLDPQADLTAMFIDEKGSTGLGLKPPSPPCSNPYYHYWNAPAPSASR